MGCLLFLYEGWYKDNTWDIIESSLLHKGLKKSVIHAPTLVYSNNFISEFSSTERETQYLIQYIIKNELYDIVIICHSFTGTIAISLLEKFPDRIKNIVIIESLMDRYAFFIFLDRYAVSRIEEKLYWKEYCVGSIVEYTVDLSNPELFKWLMTDPYPPNCYPTFTLKNKLYPIIGLKKDHFEIPLSKMKFQEEHLIKLQFIWNVRFSLLFKGEEYEGFWDENRKKWFWQSESDYLEIIHEFIELIDKIYCS